MVDILTVVLSSGAFLAMYKFDGFYRIYESMLLFLALEITYLIVLVKGLNKMVDIVTNRMFDTFNRFSPTQNHQTDSLSTISNLKRFSRDQRYKRAISREADIKNRENQLYDIKENVPDALLPKIRPFMGLSCQNCTITSRESLVNKTTERMALKNVLANRYSTKSSFLERTFNHLWQAYQVKKYKYALINDTVLADERVTYAIEKTTVEQFQDSEKSDDAFYNELLKNNKKRARKLLDDMRSTISDYILRCTSWVCYKLLPCFISSILVHPGQINMIKEASKSSLPLIFLPLHKSHLDYILITLILLNNDIKSPIVAAGDNLRIPLFGTLLRGLGAFYIKRRIDPIMGRKDHVYKAVLHTYMNQCLKAGHNVEFFLEGGRTRTGKPVMPKYGIFSVIVESFMDGTIEDALLVPVSINYDKLVDGNFIKEQLGEPKKMESFGSAVKAMWQVLNSDYGMTRVDFNQPFSLRELVKSFNMKTKPQPPVNGKKPLKSNPSTTSLYGTDVVSEEHKTLVESISKHILYDCTHSTSVMATNAVAFILLHEHRNGALIQQTVDALDRLRKDLELAGRDIAFQGDSMDVINYAIDMLGPGLVRKEKKNGEVVVKPLAELPNVIELNYYSNALVPFYAVESSIAVAIKSLDSQSGIISAQNLLEAVLDVCDMMQYEFILCKPCQSLENIVNSTIDDLITRRQIFIMETESALVTKSRRIARQFEDDDTEENSPLHYTINDDKACQEYLRFLRGTLMSLIECYCITAFSLESLVGRSLLEDELVKVILNELKTQVDQGSIFYHEAVSVDTIKNALKLFVKWDILECHNEKKWRLYYLKESQDNSEAVKILYERINKYRQFHKQI